MPGKNLRQYRGRALVDWAHISTSYRYIDFTVLSTDDVGIDMHARMMDWTCNQQFKIIDRPPELATDAASSEDVIRHALSLFPHDWVVLLQPTSPLRTAEDVDACIERAQMGDGCISINRSTGHQNGAVYVAKAEWLAKHDFTHQGLMKYPMDAERSLDIDTEADFAC